MKATAAFLATALAFIALGVLMGLLGGARVGEESMASWVGISGSFGVVVAVFVGVFVHEKERQ